MKIYKLKYFVLSLVVATFVSCDKEDLNKEQIISQTENAKHIEGVKPDGADVYKIDGVSAEEIRASHQNGKEPIHVYTPWTPINKDVVSRAGFANDGDVINYFFAVYNRLHPTAPLTSVPRAVYIGSNNAVDIYGSDPNYGNPFLDASYVAHNNAVHPHYRYDGEGTVELHTAQIGWRPDTRFSAISYPPSNSAHTYVPSDGTLFSVTSTKTVGWSLDRNASLSAEGEVGLPLVANGKITVQLEVNVGVSHDISTSLTTNFSFPNVSVPKGKRVTFQLEERWVPASTIWRIPIKFTGHFGASDIRISGSSFIGSYTFLAANNCDQDFSPQGKYKVVRVYERLSHQYQVAYYIQ